MAENPVPGGHVDPKKREGYFKKHYQDQVKPNRNPVPKPLRMIIDTLPMELKFNKAVSLLGIQMGYINVTNRDIEKACTDNIRKMLKDVRF